MTVRAHCGSSMERRQRGGTAKRRHCDWSKAGQPSEARTDTSRSMMPNRSTANEAYATLKPENMSESKSEVPEKPVKTL